MLEPETTSLQMIGNRYQILETLGSGGMGIVYRVLDRLTGDQVALKRVLVSEESLIFSSRTSLAPGGSVRLSLAQEFKMLASLRHPNIISVLDYGFDEARQPYFTMQLLQNARNIRDAGEDQTQEKQLELLLQVLQALVYLHRRGILHRDLKPDNVQVVGNQVRVLDFGLAVARETIAQPDSGVVAGTLAYMAPEILRGDTASEVSDLYAVGMIAYELLAGKYPFNVNDITQLMMDIVRTEPDITNLETPEPITQMLVRLLDKNPAKRFQQAEEVIRAIHGVDSLVQTAETDAIRESFLQAARFVGRASEIQHLRNLLKETEAGSGSAWLIGGESGVGKSRLVEEIQIMARVRGIFVLNGHTTQEGNAPYNLWRPILKLLLLSTTLEPEAAAILKSVIPDITGLVGYEVAEAPVLTDASQTRDRLFNTIASLFQKQTQPMLVVLEDLHWASESLDLLAHLTPLVRQFPLLIIATYRDDERHDLPIRLPDMQVMKLNRLSPHEIGELSAAMIGLHGQQPTVVDLLHRETDGNAFFIVEVVRALAEDAGNLENIGIMTLPEQIFAGGIQQIVQRRLSFVPAGARLMLEQAAIAGRWLDLKILRLLAGEALDSMLTQCADAAVLEVSEDRWRFVHDKLRDGLLREIPPERQAILHRQLAESIETVYPDQPEYIISLAYHWKAAGDVEKTLHYAELAGNQTALVGINTQAAKYYEQALEQLNLLPATPENRRHSVLLTLRMARSATVTLAADTLSHLQQAMTTAQELQDEGLIARTMGSIGAFYYITGQIGQAVQYLNQ
ncbi:MAG TPA: AAA family ATPase, partial [Phototrophicaceae bacterium]|nr:AAA family ATPase [Phototrophicaceae bacterium]